MNIDIFIAILLLITSIYTIYSAIRIRFLEQQLSNQAILLIAQLAKPSIDKRSVSEIRASDEMHSLGIYTVNLLVHKRPGGNIVKTVDGYLVVNVNAWVLFDDKYRKRYIASMLMVKPEEIDSFNAVQSDRRGGGLMV